MSLFRTNTMLASTVAIATLILGGCSGGVAATSDPSAVAPPPNAQNLEQAYVSVVQKVLPSVVQITTGHDLGSGIVFDTQGNIVTNAHVVGPATNFQVRLADNPQPIPATLVGSYLPDDLAVIKLDHAPSTLHPAHFGDSATLQVGDMVLAMGNPLGLTGSVTDGIISATGRAVTEPAGRSSPGATLPEAIQTSASINPGNSGGALVDLAGDVIGVPTLAAMEPAGDGGGTAPAPGIGFAIPSNVVTNGQLLASLQPGRTVPVTLTTPQGGARTVMITLGQLPGS